MNFGRRVLTGALALAATASLALPLPAATAVTRPTAASVPVPASFSFSGAGWGHGVGMSQYGARGMALEGYTGEQIVSHYYSSTTVTPVPDTMGIRVNVLHRRPTIVFRTEPLVAGAGGVRVTVAGTPDVVGDAADVWTVFASANGTTLRRTRAGVTTTIGTGASVTVHWSGTRDAASTGTGAALLHLSTSVAGLSGTSLQFRYGTMDFASAVGSPTTLEAVNTVRVHDEYLLGISEVSSSWPMESLRAQVLASRSYALAHVATSPRAACRCHVDNGYGGYYDQTFVGYSKETSTAGSRWRQAVLSTDTTASTGEAILYAGKAISAFYFSSGGGMTQNASDVWGGSLPWAVSVDDHWSMDPSVAWSVWNPRVRTQAQVAAVFGLPDVVRLDLTHRTVAGALQTVTAWSSTGVAKTVSGPAFAGSSGLGLPSRWVWRTGDTPPGEVTAAAATAASASTSAGTVIAPSSSPTSIAIATVVSVRKGWPLLLSSGGGLPAATVADLKRRRSTSALVVGTTADVPAAVLTALSALGVRSTRITGATDSDVSVVAAKVMAYPYVTPALVASATDRSVLAITAAAAANLGRPLLVEPGGTAAAPSVTAYLSVLRPSRTVVVGTVAAVADSVVAGLPSSSRLTGLDIGQTSAFVMAQLGMAVSARLVVATPATAVAALLAAKGAPMVVVTSALPGMTVQYLQRGVATVVSPTGTPAALTWSARRV